MSQKLTPQVAQQLQAAFQSIQQGKAEEALRVVKRLLRKHPRQIDILHLAALAYKSNGDFALAEQFFVRCLGIEASHFQVLNNLANLQKSQGKFEAAIQNYAKALAVKPDYLEARRNLGLCQVAAGDLGAGQASLEGALELSPSDPSTLTALGDCARKQALYEEAKRYYQHALEQNKQSGTALHNLGLTYHLEGQIDLAKQYYQRSFDIAPDQTAQALSLANVTHELGDSAQALEILMGNMKSNPSNVDVHNRYNELLWELGREDEFGASYELALQNDSENEQLKAAYGHQLFRAGLNSRALSTVRAALQSSPKSPELKSLYGQVLAEQGELDAAAFELSNSLDIRFDKDTAQQLCKIHIINQNYAKAQALIQPLQKNDPECQLTWAIQSLIWRLVGDERYAWLCDYEQLVRSYKLSVPEGYESVDQFLTKLETTLLNLHLTEQAPLEQTLRHGTQTAARLFFQQDTTINAFKLLLQQIVAEYIESMPSSSDHPFYSRRSNSFEFSGSWSVKLKANGFHVNHVHPAGWISSSSYISLPSSLSSASEQGAIKFGESPLGLGEREVVEKLIRPEPGMVVLFPSYVWHGTVPFAGDESDFRLTAPFDVVPA